MKAQRRGQEIEKADPAARRRAIVVLAAGLALGALLIVLTADYRRDLTAWAQQNPARAFDLILPVAGGSIVLPVLAMAWYFWRLGARIVREERFPPANTAWARTTYVIRGAAAGASAAGLGRRIGGHGARSRRSARAAGARSQEHARRAGRALSKGRHLLL